MESVLASPGPCQSVEPVPLADGMVVSSDGCLDELPAVPHDDRVLVDYDPVTDVSFCTDIITGEQHSLPGEWVVIFLDGQGCLGQDGTEDTHYVDSIMKSSLRQGKDSRVYLVENGCSQDFTAAVCKYGGEGLSWSYCAGRPPVELSVCKLALPRNGQHVFWCLDKIYKILGLKTHRGVPSKWVYETYPQWQATMRDFGIHANNLMLSMASSGMDVEPHGIPHRFLPTNVCSSLGLMFLLLRWGQCPANKNGLVSDKCRGWATELLEGMVAAVCHGSQVAIEVYFTDDFELQQPRPCFCHSTSIEIVIGLDGLVDISEWRQRVEAAELDKNDPVRVWWQKLQCNKLGDRVHIAKLLAKCFFVKQGMSLFKQVIWTLASKLDSLVMAGCRAPWCSDCAGDCCNLSNLTPVVLTNGVHGSNKQVDSHLGRYVTSCRDVLDTPRNFSLSTDKGNVKGCNLVNTVGATPKNDAAVMPPQAPNVCNCKV